MSRIFLSHSSANNAQALAVAAWLEDQGWSDYFLDIDEDRGIAPGERWMAALTGGVAPILWTGLTPPSISS